MQPRLQRQPFRPYGVVRDVAASIADPALWTDARNVRFIDESIRRQLGYIVRPEKPLFLPERLHYRRYKGADQFLYAGNDGIGLMEGGQFDITPTDYPLPGILSVGDHQWTDLNGIPVWCHPQLTPGFHDGETASKVQDLPGWPADWLCDVIRSFKFYLLALAPVDQNGGSPERYGNQIRWSASANVGNLPDEWVPSATNDAGDMFFADAPGDVIDAVPLKDALIVYKNSATYVMEFVGDVFVFKQRSLFPTTGILTRNCATEWRGRHFLASENDLLVHDGNTAKSVCDRVVRKEIFDDINANYVNRSFVYHDTATFEMSFCWASRSSDGWCDRRAVWRYMDERRPWYLEELEPQEISHAALGNYAVSGLGDTWDEDDQAWDLDSSQWDSGAETGSADQTLTGIPVTIDLGQPIRGALRNGEQVLSEMAWETKDLGRVFHDGELPRQIVLVTRLWIDAIGPGVELNVRLGFQECDGATVELTPQQTFKVGQDCYLDINREGRLVSVYVSCVSAIDWTINSMVLEYYLTGRF